jgi:hypothetical protein
LRNDSQADTVREEPSVPVVAYLCADRFVPKHSVLLEETSIPCSKVSVQRGELAVQLLSSAFWSLREQALVHLELIERGTSRRIRHPEVRLGSSRRVERPGLEGALILNLEDGETVHDVICRWAKVGSTDPWHDVIAECVKEAVAVGLIREVDVAGRGLMKFLGHQVGLEPDCSRIAALYNRGQELASAWREFQRREKPLHDGLAGQCRRALEACTERWYS